MIIHPKPHALFQYYTLKSLELVRLLMLPEIIENLYLPSQRSVWDRFTIIREKEHGKKMLKTNNLPFTMNPTEFRTYTRKGGLSMKIKRLDHLVLTVKNIEETCNFYSTVMGMEVQTFGNGRKALQFGSQKINLHQTGNEFDPKANKPTPGSADLCFVTDTPIEKVIHELEIHQVRIIEGPVERTGAAGKLQSVYFRDPDMNLIEVSNYV